MEIVIDKIALWTADFQDGYSVRKMPVGVRYKASSGEMVLSDKPIFRYAKTYERDGVKFLLFVRTFRDNMAVIEKELDEVAESLETNFIREALSRCTMYNFEYLNNNLKGEE